MKSISRDAPAFLFCLVALLSLVLPGCRAPMTTDEVATTGQAAEEAPRQEATRRMALRTIGTRTFSMTVPETWQAVFSQDGTSGTILDGNDQPRLIVVTGSLDRKESAQRFAAGDYAASGGAHEPRRVAPGVYAYTVEAGSGEQVPVVLRVRGRQYVRVQIHSADDNDAAEAAASLRVR